MAEAEEFKFSFLKIAEIVGIAPDVILSCNYLIFTVELEFEVSICYKFIQCFIYK